METGPTRENSRFTLMGLLCTDMERDRFKLEPICRPGLGLREAGSRASTKSPFRCLVRLVRCTRHITVQTKLAEYRPLNASLPIMRACSATSAMLLFANSVHCADADHKPLDEESLRSYMAGEYELIGRKADSVTTYNGHATLR